MLYSKEQLAYQSEYSQYAKYTHRLFWYRKYKDEDWSKGQNFGDYLSTIIVGEVAKRFNLKSVKNTSNHLLAIGSILHFAKDNDIVWGSGINGKINLSKLSFNTLDVRSVRGPLSRDILIDKGIDVEPIFGDPALLLPIIFPDMSHSPVKGKQIAIPNLNEFDDCVGLCPSDIKLVSPLSHWRNVLSEILSSEYVLTSSLHGLILSEAFHVPVRLFEPFGGETLFKYEDYLEGTGRKLTKIPPSFNESFQLNDGVELDKLDFDADKLLDVFPRDMFVK